MDHISFLSDRNILLLLEQLFLILALAKLFSLPFKKMGLSALPAEILVGILLGPTILGRVAPELWHYIFPPIKEQHYMLDTIGWMGILFVLLTTGMELHLSSAWRLRRQVAVTSLVTLTIPMVLALGVAFVIPDSFFANGDHALGGRLFTALILATVSLPLALRTMGDFGILRSDFGVLGATALSVIDVVAWFFLMTILNLPRSEGISLQSGITTSIFMAFLIVIAIGGGRIIGEWFRSHPEWTGLARPSMGRDFSIMVLTGMVLGILSTLIGIHPFSGFFLAGLSLSAARIIKEGSATSIGTFMESIFVPVFFASSGLRFDFIANFDSALFLVFSVVAIALRFLGAWAGASLSRMPKNHRSIFAILNIPGGEIHIIGGMITFELTMIDARFLTAIIGGTLVSSMLVSPLVALSLRVNRGKAILDFLPLRGVIHELPSRSRNGALADLCRQAAGLLGQDESRLLDAVMGREAIASTALGLGLAFPHARLDDLDEAIIIPARSRAGIDDWESHDGKPVTTIFLIVSPAHKEDLQLKILRQLVRKCQDASFRTTLLNAESDEEFYLFLRKEFASVPIG